MITPLQALGYALLAGIVPALIWLYFLLREDRRNPEPPFVIFLAFVAGMLAVLLVIFPESVIQQYAVISFKGCEFGTCLPVIISWAAIEEVAKYLMCALFVLWRRDVDESLDLVIYMITTALGFAALENTLFLIAPFSQGHISDGLLTDNLRFIGSTVLHVMASSIIGFTLAFTYKKMTTVSGYAVRAALVSFGLILAITLHSVFNFLIINNNSGERVLAFFTVWTAAIVFFAVFELLKYFRYRTLPTTQ